MSKAGNLIKRLTDKHRKIERFGVLALVGIIALSSVTGTILVKTYKDKHQQLSTQAVYTVDFEMSRSHTTGKVVDVYTNANKTSALLLLKFDDMAHMSTDANNYVCFLRGYDPNKGKEPLEAHPACALYVFGTTGYVGLHMVDKNGFPNQIEYLTIRNDKELVEVDGGQVAEGGSQYDVYDLTDIYFNPGAAGTTVVECLNNEVVTVKDMYEECIARSREQELRAILEDDLLQMRTTMVQISEYEQRLVNMDIALNTPYGSIAGDYIVNKDGLTVGSLDYQAQLADYVDGEHLRLMSNTVCVGGVDFDWYNGSIHDGYINSLKGDMTPQQYINSIMTPPEGSEDDKQVPDKWYFLSSGQEFTLVSQGGKFNQTATDIQTQIGYLTTAWNTYYSIKQKYECTDLINLLDLDYEVMSVENNFTINNRASAFIIS